jgi:hypothetical protein
MLSPLPRVYEEGHNGQAVPSEPEPTMIGGDVQVERLTSAAQETKKRLDIEVLQPIKQWMVAYRTIMVRPLQRLKACAGSTHAPRAAREVGITPRPWGAGCSCRRGARGAAGWSPLCGGPHLLHAHRVLLLTHTACSPLLQRQERMKRLEALRLELDSRRRTVTDLQGEPSRLLTTPFLSAAAHKPSAPAAACTAKEPDPAAESASR